MNDNSVSVVDKFKGKKVLVIGDIMLDKHIYCAVSRISPEAPVPVLNVERESINPGGAANLANNIVHLGGEAYLSGVVGNDEAQRTLFHELEKNHIDMSCVIKTSKPTIQKIRGVAHQQLFRVDYEDTSLIPKEKEEELLSLIKTKIPEVDAIVLVDYAKGMLTESLVKELITLGKNAGKLITVDCKPMNVEFYKGVDVVKPNKKEAIEMTLTDNIPKAGEMLKEKLDTNVVITLASEGCSIFEKNKEPVNIPAAAKTFYDVAGAGDTFLATLTLSLVCGSSLKESARIANKASGIVISKPGVETITSDELKMTMASDIKVVGKEWGEEQWIVNNEKYCGKKMLIKEGYYCSYHKHKVKEETFYVLEGNLEVIKEGVYSTVGSGGTLHINPNQYHSFRALENTTFFEFSTHHEDEDNYRLTRSGKGSHEEWKAEIESLVKNKE